MPFLIVDQVVLGVNFEIVKALIIPSCSGSSCLSMDSGRGRLLAGGSK